MVEEFEKVVEEFVKAVEELEKWYLIHLGTVISFSLLLVLTVPVMMMKEGTTLKKRIS